MGKRFERPKRMERQRPTRAADLAASVKPRELPDSLVRRVVIDEVQPCVDGGRFPIKRTRGEQIAVTAVIIADGHDALAGALKYRPVTAGAATAWSEVVLEARGNDRWTASFAATTLGIWEYTIEAWIDRYASWLHGLEAKFDAGQSVESELLEGAELVQAALRVSTSIAGSAADSEDDLHLLEIADLLRSPASQHERVAAARDASVSRLMRSRASRETADRFEPPLRVTIDAERARFSAWYELFPRSCTPDATRSGTLREAEVRLADIAAMGFDVVYLPPIHPIGRTHRKGRNNALVAAPGDPGSPWAIGGTDGGHTSVHAELGTLNDFDRFVHVANRLGIEIALDIAFQASPDHPWVRQHPAWFRHRPDGSIKYAENPPKKYQDIYPLDFESHDWRSLWTALRDIFLFWIEHGVRIFRVDNPHTKSFRFWEWCIASVQRSHPDVIFLAEAFTRPSVMRYLAKVGFSQSYTYFTWRNTSDEIRGYLTELTSTDLKEFMRPNFFANTPDILHAYLQHGGRAAFEVRLLLAATLSASYGIYSGFELCEREAVRPGSEEYLDSEKYQIRIRDWDTEDNISELIAQINAIRHRQPALQRNDTLRFHETDNPELLAYSKTDDRGRRVFMVVNMDPHHLQHGWVRLTDAVATSGEPYAITDVLDETRYTWRGEWNYVRLDPSERVGHIFVVDAA